MQLSDTQVITFLQSGDESLEDQACRFLYRQYYGLIEALVVKNGSQKLAAKDIFQEGIIVLWNMCQRTNFELTSTVKTLLYSINYNILRNQQRSRGKVRELQDIHQNIPVENTFFDILLLSEKNDLLRQLLESLGKGCQKILHLYYFQRLKMKKIQTIFKDKSDAVTKNRKSRCLKQLREIVLSNEQYVANLKG